MGGAPRVIGLGCGGRRWPPTMSGRPKISIVRADVGGPVGQQGGPPKSSLSQVSELRGEDSAPKRAHIVQEIVDTEDRFLQGTTRAKKSIVVIFWGDLSVVCCWNGRAAVVGREPPDPGDGLVLRRGGGPVLWSTRAVGTRKSGLCVFGFELRW